MKIYSLNTTDFSNNGYGFLTDVISAEVKEELNGEYTLTMEYLLNGHLSEYLQRENIILCKTADGTEQPFRIKYIDRNFKTINIVAYHISYDLGDDVAINIAPTNLQVQAFGRWILNNATTHSNTYTFNSDIATIGSARYIRKNVLECIMGDDENSMLTKFGGEIKRDGYTITLNSRIGQDKGVRLLLGKNLNEIKITIDDTGLYTRVCPVGYDGLTLPEIYVDSPLINNYPFPKECVIKFEDIRYDETGQSEGSYDNLPDFYDALRDAVAKMYNEGLDKPLVNVDIDWIDLSKTEEYKNYASLETIALGDTLTCDMGDFYYQTRIIATTYDVLLDRITNFEIGKPIANYASKTNATIQQVESQDTSSLLEQAQANASALLKSAMTGYIYFDYEHGDLYIMDNSDPQLAQKVWRWNLNGLGYSSTGINGTYGLAITMDGSIVADYITTGTLNTSVIQGYDSLVQQVEDIENLLLEERGTSTLSFEEVSYNVPYYLKVYPTLTDLSYTYPHNALYPSSSLFMQTRTIRFHNLTTNENIDYELPCDLLYYDDSHFDTLTIDGKNLTCIKTKMVEIDDYGVKSVVPTEYIYYQFLLPTLTAGDYEVSMLTYNDVYLELKLVRQNDITNVLASTAYVGSKITQTTNDINLEVQQKVNEDEIIAKLNLGIQDGQGVIDITGNQVKITSDYFTLDETGHIEATSGDIGGFQLTSANFNNNINGLYDYSYYDLNIIKGFIFSYLVANAYNVSIYDLTGDSNIQLGDYSKMKAIINGTVENEKVLTGKFVINSDNPKNCVQVLDNNNNAVVSIGIGGINSNLIATENISIMDLDDWEASSSPKGVYANKNGELTATAKVSSAAFVNTSEEKKKKNIEKVKSGLDILKDIDIYTYNYKDETKRANKKHYGVVIGDDYNYSQEITDNKNEGVDLYSFISVCCASIKEQQEEIEQLKEEIKNLKGGKK